MTEREKQLIAGYLPNPRDPELQEDEYYVRDSAGRVRKVYVRDIWPHDESTEYGVYEVGTGRRIDAGYGDLFRGFRKGHMYDNREDCRNHEHEMYDGWEELREIQQEELRRSQGTEAGTWTD